MSGAKHYHSTKPTGYLANSISISLVSEQENLFAFELFSITLLLEPNGEIKTAVTFEWKEVLRNPSICEEFSKMSELNTVSKVLVGTSNSSNIAKESRMQLGEF